MESLTAAPVNPPDRFPIVGIGASAGGLAAFEAFFAAMPVGLEIGMAFVLVQHLAPDHKSLLGELIQRYSTMPVFEVEHGMRVQPNCVYIIPPNRDLALLDGALQLFEPSTPRGLRLPIDFFFHSLAQDQQERAICIVLSGTGRDGTLGVRAVKGSGGMVMVQTPDSTEYDGMPRSAMATGLVDYVLPPTDMPAQLMAYVAFAFGQKPPPLAPPIAPAGEALKQIFSLLRSQTRHDFSQYKQSTIGRRVERRMALQQLEQLDEYVRYLQQSPAEVDALFRELLIGVTRFFRDPAAFEVLTTQVIQRLFAGKAAGAGVRIWVPGCSTGEEAYSIAILLYEQMAALKQQFEVRIFATDIDSRAVETARAGVYPANIAADIAPERLARFFTYDEAHSVYRINKEIRALLVISEQDVIQAPPFSRLDLISCRNLLIYLEAALQQKLIPLFHYALNPGGFLWLGSSETVGDFMTLFAPVDRKWKLYQRQDDLPLAHRPVLAPLFEPNQPEETQARLGGPLASHQKRRLRELTERVLLAEYAPVSVLVNAQGDILYIHGRTGRYLEPAPGEATLNIQTMAREGLQRALAIALHKVGMDNQPLHYPNLPVRTNGTFSLVHLTVRPVAAPGLYLVTLTEATAQPADEPGLSPEATPPRSALDQELRAKEDYLQATNEELQAANEEMQAANEELQSTNEELETSKEELQSINEELTTINAELQQKVAELSQVSNDMNNLLASTGVGTIFVDHHLCIQRFTPNVTPLIHLIATDVGRPIGDIVAHLLGYDHLVADVQAVLASLTPQAIEVQTPDGVWYLLNIRPYRTLKNVIEGAVLTFVDITRLKKAESLQRLAVIVRDAQDAITLNDLQGNILAWNPAAVRLYGWSEDEALRMNITTLLPEHRRTQEATMLQALSQATVLAPYRTERLTKDGRMLALWLTATALVNDAAEVYAITTTGRVSDPALPGEGERLPKEEQGHD